jgi:hypothetical protein
MILEVVLSSNVLDFEHCEDGSQPETQRLRQELIKTDVLSKMSIEAQSR